MRKKTTYRKTNQKRVKKNIHKTNREAKTRTHTRKIHSNTINIL